jgi:hypothetical protein
VRKAPSFDLSEIDLSAETHALLPIRSDAAPLQEQRAFGTWWIAPFARTDDRDLVGLRAIPTLGLAEGPVVWASGPATVTIASTSHRAVPVLVFSRMVTARRHWKAAAELLDVEWDELAGAHRCLGGDDALATLREVAGDEQLRARCQAPGIEGRAAVAEVLDHLDPSPARRRVRDLLSGQQTEADLAPTPAAWSAAVVALGFEEKAPLAQRLHAAWGMFQAPAGLDVCWAAPIDPWPRPVATRAAKGLHAAARLLSTNDKKVPPEWRDDPLWSAIDQLARVDDPFSFPGAPFLEAAAALDEQGQAERALNAATAVQFWSYLSDGPVMDGALEAAHMLASRQRWAALRTVTEAVLAEIQP